jgi:ppGpp synthetase/RelA/SpoT-type nucleotidyltranferase
VILRLYPDARVIDRRERPQFGYRAVHVVVKEDGRYIEVQVRTVLQNTWAQVSEKFADIYGHSIKYGNGPAHALDYLKVLSDYCLPVEASEIALDGFRKTEINALHKKKRSKKKMTDFELARFSAYRELQNRHRAAKKRLMKYLKENLD